MAEFMSEPFLRSLNNIQKIRNFEGDSTQFWQFFLETLIELGGALSGLIILRTGEETAPWKTLAKSQSSPESLEKCIYLEGIAPSVVEACSTGFTHIRNVDFSVIAVSLMVDVDPQKCYALFFLNSLNESEAKLRINALLSVKDLPAQFRIQQAADNALQNQGRLTDILDLMVLMNSQNRFLAASMTLCNELANRYSCNRVCLGWLKKGYIRIQAMSHTDQFEKKMEAVQQLELAMEEALDQETDILSPAPEGSSYITRDHDAYRKALNAGPMATLLLRKKDKVVGLCSFERPDKALNENELRHLQTALDLVTSRLDELKKYDRWFGARFAYTIREKAAGLVGHEHTWAKLCAASAALILMFAAFIPIRYRVDSPMILRTDDVTYITAPFDGYIDTVEFRAGDIIPANKPLLSLDKRDLLLEESGLLAEKNRQQREIEKARASGELADMCIAQARYDQITAKLDINHYKLDQASILAPYEGVVIEGDLLEKTGSPVKQGEILLKIGRIKDIYAEAKVSEAEIQNIAVGSYGQIALASRPQDQLDVFVKLIEPSAVVGQKGNIFLVRCSFKNMIPGWLRPGMTGVSKINSGNRTLLWIVSHRTIDFIRLKLWL